MKKTAKKTVFPKCKIIGVGGAGGNAINRMAKFRIPGVDLVAINTDAQDLKKISADFKLRIGCEITKGLGTGMNPKIGRKAAEEQKKEIKEVLMGSDLIFIAFGLGGGTGTGAAPVVAEIAKTMGILTVAVATKPFSFEGASRKAIAQQGIKEIIGKVDSLILVSNDKLVFLADKNMLLAKAFFLADEILREAMSAVVDLIVRPSLVTISFADIVSIFKNSGQAYFGQGDGHGQNRSQEAVLAALNSPLLETTFGQATKILFNISAGNLKLAEIDLVANLVTKNISSQTQVVFGAREDEKLGADQMRLTLIAAGI